ncbi:MAG: DUF169 domain-containing protein [Anaerolineaceae bacterium]|nr:DUF169 domain-containing protein [Anaerolineaceae bacterium]HPT24662.1 DUF169 domain-containing protein [Anaerolineaceae bacterium]
MNPKELSENIVRILHLETYPVAVTLYEKEEDMPRHPLPHKHNFCQIVSMARTASRTNASVPEKMICAFGAASIGLIETPEVIRSGAAAVGAYMDDPVAAKNFMNNVYKLGDTGKKYAGVMVQALADVEEGQNPDVVLIYCNPLQAMRLIHANAYDTGEKITADTVAEGAMCSAVGFAAGEKKATIGFPCAGDRIFGGTQSYELVFAAPYDWVQEKLVNNLEQTAKGGFSVIPISPNMNWTPAMPSAYTIQQD